ncbi:hypothetical protein GGX14DRAFT_696352 [Mycena pura]|uniref:Uncharacterized protein n=1 Tax=Mycena pura TaxID=153505 RepID=A0AAD6YGZ3_9AGAR|nr:hypothetical protein GGX14DRAFT_696352 [Mycena pura]
MDVLEELVRSSDPNDAGNRYVGTDSDLRRRIGALESDLKTARLATEEAEAQLESTRTELKKAERGHHAARNLASYGHTDGIIFVEPEDLDQSVIYRLAKGKGTRASVCRFMVRYNIDQFLQRPVLHQWMQNGRLYREAHDLQSSRFELFFDLLFVGMVHQIAEAAAEQPTGTGFAKYVLTFAPAFSIWSDVRDMANQYANDDVTQRAYILWIMMLLVGYSNNASAIEFGKKLDDGGDGSGFTTESLRSMQWTLGFFVVAKLSGALLSLVYSAFLPLSRRPLMIRAINPAVLAILFFVAIFTPLHVTIALVAIGIVMDLFLRVLGVLLLKTVEILGKKYDMRRRLCHSISPGAEKSIIADQATFEGIRTVNSSTTAVDEEAPLGDLRICQSMAAREQIRWPAINIEHHIERLGAFVTVVLGEMVVNVFFATSGPAGLSMESGRALLSLMIAFNFNWMYFGSPASKHFVHAIRRHWFAGFLFTNLHLPLCMSLLLASSAINRLVTSALIETEPGGGGLKWFFGAGLGVSLLVMASIGVLHRNLDTLDGITAREHQQQTNKVPLPRTTVSRRVVLGTRYVAGLAMILVPLAEGLTSIQFLSVYVGITVFLIVEETFARIERRDLELDREDDLE